MLAALAAVTDRLGLTGTINTTFNEPFEVARQFATLDHLSDGRAGWNIVTSSDAFTGENFRRGGFLDHSDRYKRAEEFLTVAREFWDSWAPDAVVADVENGIYVDPSRIRVVEHHGPQFDVRGVATLPRGPQGHPVLLQAGDSADGRAFLAKYADAAFTLHSSLGSRPAYYADVKARAASYGRDPRPAQGVSGGDVRARRHRRGGRRQGPPHPAPAGQRPDRDRDARAGLAARPVRTTTPTARCPMSIRPTTRPSPRAASGTVTRRPSPPPGANVRRRRTCPSAN